MTDEINVGGTGQEPVSADLPASDVAHAEPSIKEEEKVEVKKESADSPVEVTAQPAPVNDMEGVDDYFDTLNEGLEEETFDTLNQVIDNQEVFKAPFHEQLLPQHKEIPTGKKVDFTYSLSVINRTAKRVEDFINSFPNEDIRKTSLGERFSEAIETTEKLYLLSDELDRIVNDPNVRLHQRVPYQDKGTCSASVLNPTSTTGKRIEGEAAVLRLSHALGDKRIIRFPLYGTGIWLAMKPPSDEAIYTLYTEVMNDTEVFGRATGGGLFTNSQVIVMQRLLQFAVDHIYETNFEFNNRTALIKVISLLDSHQLLTFALAAIHQGGYPFSSTCIANPSNCNYERKTMLNIASMSRTFTDKLSENQLRLVYTRPEKVTTEQVNSYKQEFVFSEALRFIDLNDSVKMELKVPTLEEYFEAGSVWVASVIEKADKGLSVPLAGKKRENYITGLSKMSILRQYSHYVKAIYITNEKGQVETFDDRLHIDLQLNSLSGNGAYVDKVFGTIDKFSAEATITLCTLVEDHTCPQCGGIETNFHKLQEQKYPNLLVIDPSVLFFTVAGLHIARIL